MEQETIKNIICVIGPSQSGKDQFSRYFQQCTGFKTVAFADYLKIQLAKTLDIPKKYLYNKSKDKNITIFDADFNLRIAMEDISNVMKNQIPDFYARSVEKDIAESNNIIVTDLRFTVELEYLQQKFADRKIIVIEIDRPNIQRRNTKAEQDSLNIVPDWIVDNNGTLNTLRASAITIAKQENIYKERKRHGSKKNR